MPDTGQGDTSVLKTLFDHHQWANLKLIEACESLTEAQLDATAPGGYGAVRATLLHIVGAEIGYVVRVTGQAPPIPLSREHFPSFPALKEVARWSSQELFKLALSAREESLVREEEDELVWIYPLAGLMVQAITHATEHRAQVATILTQLGLEPPDMSVWLYMEEVGLAHGGDSQPAPETSQ